MKYQTFKRLLKYPHAAVFDKDPQAELAFRLSHPHGASWVIDDGVMEAKAGATSYTYDLRPLSVIALIASLRADGFDVLQVNGRFNGMSALVLVDGKGSELVSNGDHITAFTSLLWALFSGYAAELDVVHYQIRQALLQMVIKTAEGEWLDLWGELYDVPRNQYEADDVYRVRIPAEAFRIRVNAMAIEKAIFDITGKKVRILEPWTTVFVLDDSILDGDDKLQDSTHIGYFFIQPQSDISIDWSDVLPIIERNRPAGVLMLPPQVNNGSWVVVDHDYVVGTSIKRRHVGRAVIEDMALLDYALIEDVSTANYPFLHKRLINRPGTGVEVPAGSWPSTPWPDTDWNSIKYTVVTKYWSSFRTQRSGHVYVSRPWLPIEWPGKKWSEDDVVIGASHKRLS